MGRCACLLNVAVPAQDSRHFHRDPNRLSCSPSELELSYLTNVGCSSNRRNYLKGFQKRENKSNQTVTVYLMPELSVFFHCGSCLESPPSFHLLSR